MCIRNFYSRDRKNANGSRIIPVERPGSQFRPLFQWSRIPHNLTILFSGYESELFRSFARPTIKRTAPRIKGYREGHVSTAESRGRVRRDVRKFDEFSLDKP